MKTCLDVSDTYNFRKLYRFLFYSGILCSGGAVNHYVSGVVTSLLQLNIEDNYLDKLIPIYRVSFQYMHHVLFSSRLRTPYYNLYIDINFNVQLKTHFKTLRKEEEHLFRFRKFNVLYL